jgi:hypothetical protein
MNFVIFTNKQNVCYDNYSNSIKECEKESWIKWSETRRRTPPG